MLGTVVTSREVPMTLTPSAVSASPVARPMPREAPVMTASFPPMSRSGANGIVEYGEIPENT